MVWTFSSLLFFSSAREIEVNDLFLSLGKKSEKQIYTRLLSMKFGWI